MTRHGLSDQTFLDRIAAETQNEGYRRFAEHEITRQHPSAEMLYDYAAGQLSEDTAPAVRAHLALCGECAREALRLMQVTDELEQAALNWADSSEKPLSESVSAAIAGAKTAGERAWLWISELWQPQWAGQLVTAADAPEQHHDFPSQHGDIHLTCSWRDDSAHEPAILSIAWQAELLEEDRVWLRFVNPVTQSLRQEIFLGTRAVGEEQFTIQDLNFDFVRDQWAIALALETSSS